nr:MAG TPA: hypothetical protein [Caudoviricetes sp.]
MADLCHFYAKGLKSPLFKAMVRVKGFKFFFPLLVFSLLFLIL